jgi:hypothetical protein
VRGYDATFSAPKSVSVLFAVGDEQIREQVVEAHDSAVRRSWAGWRIMPTLGYVNMATSCMWTC